MSVYFRKLVLTKIELLNAMGAYIICSVLIRHLVQKYGLYLQKQVLMWMMI